MTSKFGENSFKNKTVTVIGIGISNIPLINFLSDQGAKITARDIKTRENLGTIADELIRKNVTLVCGENYLDDIKEDYIFRTPGVRFDKPEIQKAVQNGSVLTSEMELFFALKKAKTIAVTGSDGKTTTTTLLYKMLECEYKNKSRVYVGGNIGAPLLPYVNEMGENDFAVLELSSFQLHTMKDSPDIAVITNITPNHLDYHKDMEEYTNAKKNIFLHMKKGGRVVLNFENEITSSFLPEVLSQNCRPVMFSSKREYEGKKGCDYDIIYLKDNAIYYENEKILDIDNIIVPGMHNLENFMAAIGAVYPFVSKETIVHIARTFTGVEHRIELVRKYNGVKYYNSSIDSSPSRTAAALACFNQKLIVICGGKDKGVPFDSLAKPLCEKAKALILTGAARDKIYESITCSSEYKTTPFPIYIEADFDCAVRFASKLAKDGDIVLLSPACTSFDAFNNFMERGNKFKEIINNLK